MACFVFILVGFEELLYFCLHIIVYPFNTQEPVVQFQWSCAILSVSEFWVLAWLHYNLNVSFDFSCFSFAEECFTSYNVVNFRAHVMWHSEVCIFCGFGVGSSENVYQVCLLLVWVQALDILVNFLSGWSNIDSGVLKSPTIIVWESKSFLSH